MNRLLVRAQREREDGNALVFALLVLFVCVSIAAIVAALALTNSLTSKNLNASLAYQAATDTAISNALQVANAPAPNGGYNVLYSHQGKVNAVTGQSSAASSSYPVKWRWYTTRVASVGGSPNSWYIYADAYTSSPTEAKARHVRRTFVPLVSASATSSSNANGTPSIIYSADIASAFQFGTFGTNSISFADNSKVYSYDSTTTLNPAGTTNSAQVASNNTLTLGANTGLNTFSAFGPNATCTPAANCSSVTIENPPFQISMADITNKIAAACPNDASTYASWSSNTGATLVNGGCYNTLTFNSNVNILNKTTVYVKGNVTVTAGSQVNYHNSPENLQIYSQVGTNATFTNGSVASPTYFNGLVAGASLNCADTATSAASSSTLFLYGAVACATVAFGPATTMWVDAAAANATPSTNLSTIYTLGEYQVYSN